MGNREYGARRAALTKQLTHSGTNMGGRSMCFSAEADFVGGAVIGLVGLASLKEARTKQELPLAALPLAFAAHQIAEGFVWLGLEGKISRAVSDFALHSYVLYAWALLPLLAPVAIYLVEPLRRRRQLMAPLVAVGALVAAYLLVMISGSNIGARIAENTIQYTGAGGYGGTATVLYVLATCGAFLLSSHRRIMMFGVVNLLAVVAIAKYQAEALTSLWCAWAAIASVLFYLHFVELRRSELTKMRGAEARSERNRSFSSRV